MAALRLFNDILIRIGSWGTIFFMAVIAVVIPYEVIGRDVFAKMTIWSGEISTFSLVWASMLGAAVGLKKGYQLNMETIVKALPPQTAKILKRACYLCMLFFFGVMFYYGLFQTFYNRNQTSPALELVMSIPYAALPTGFFIMFSLTLEEFLCSLLKQRPQG